jgi:uncharacterized membrane protein
MLKTAIPYTGKERDVPLMTPQPARQTRIQSVDALRGFVMIVMALDHTREFFNAAAMSFQPDDLTRTTPALFLTRWITHFCAPVFMFTAGAGAFLWMSRGHSRSELSRFLWTRGLWLALLELTAMRFALNFNLTEGIVLLSILWALGWSMVALAFLARLPVRWLAAISIATIALHNLADPVNASRFGGAAWVWNIMHQVGFLKVGGVQVLVAYPLVPWAAVMSAGFCFGQVLTFDPARRRRWMVRIGLALTLAFFVIRGINAYGDPAPWKAQDSGVMTVLSFLRCSKYPPSLDFLLMTLGPAILLMAWLDRVRLGAKNPLIVYGRVPLFYFLLHLLLIHLLAILFALVRYGTAGFLLHPLPSLGGPVKYPSDFGYNLAVVYAVWIGVVVMLYPACRWFAGVKERRRDWWLGYL